MASGARSVGSPLQVDWPTTEKARCCQIELRVHGTRSSPFTEDRREQRPCTPNLEQRSSLGYVGVHGTIKQSPPEQIPCWRFAAGKEASTIHHTCNQRRDKTVECVKQGALPSAGPLRRHPVLPAGGTPSSPMEAPRPPRREAYVKQAAVVGY